MTTITNLADVQPGDIVTFEYNAAGEWEGPFTGPSRLTDDGDILYVPGTLFSRAKGETPGCIRFISAERPKPVLPTEQPAYIFITKARGETLDKPVFAALDDEGDWYSTRALCGNHFHQPHHIEEWTLAEVREVKP